MSFSVWAQTTILSGNNFANFPSGWTISKTGSSTATVVAGGTPSGSGNRLELVNAVVNSGAPNGPSPDALSAEMNLKRYRGVSSIVIQFDLKLARVIDPSSGLASAMSLQVGVKSDSNAVLFSNRFSSDAGGGASALVGFGDQDNSPKAGNLDPGSWYRVAIEVPGVGSDGDTIMTVTGLNGASVRGAGSPYSPVSKVVLSQAVTAGLQDYSKLFFKAGTDSANYNLNASVANITITTVPSPRYTDNDLALFPADWAVHATGASSATVSQVSMPLGTTGALHLLNGQVNSGNPNGTVSDALSATLDFGAFPKESAIRISFDLKLTQVMDPVSGVATTNAFWVAVKDGADNVVTANLFQRWSGGTASSAIGFGNTGGYPVEGYVDVGQWYHVDIDLVAGNSTGQAKMTVTGLGGAMPHGPASPYPAVSSVVVTQTFSTPADFSKIMFKSGVSWGNFNSDAYVTNLSVTTQPRSVLVNTVVSEPSPVEPTGSDAFTIDLPSPSNSTTVSVADFGASTSASDNSAAFNSAISYCRTNSAARLIVPTGTYHFTQNTALNFSNMQDFEFDGQGSTFVFLHTSQHLVNIFSSNRVELKNFSVDWDWAVDPLASIVEIVAVHSAGEYVDLRFVDYSYFPKRDVVLARSLVPIDPATMSPGFPGGSGIFFGGTYPAYTWLSGDTLRMYANDSTTSMTKAQLAYGLKVGDYCRVEHKSMIIAGINMAHNTHLTLSDVTVNSVPGFAFFSWGDQHHWQFLNCNVKKPAGVARAITSTSDAYHAGPQQGYFLMDGCDFGYNGDDLFNFADTAGTAVRSGTYQITTQGLRNMDPYHVGDMIELRQDDYSPTGFTAAITAISTVNASAGTHIFTFAQPVPSMTGDRLVLFNKRYGAKNIIIRNSAFHNNQARGFYLHCQNVTIENCDFFHNQLGAIHINAGFGEGWAEGYGARNIIIRGNRIEQANPALGYPLDKNPALDIYTFIGSESSLERAAYPILGDILIEDNEFVDFPGVAIAITSAENVIIRDNSFSVSGPVANNPSYRGAITAGYANDIYILGNNWVPSIHLNPVYIEDLLSTEAAAIYGNTSLP